MANPEHLALLKQGVTIWNEWRKANPGIAEPDLRGVDLYNAALRGANLSGVSLRRADLRGADLRGADLREANFRGARLGGASLSGADLYEANLDGADLYKADLSWTILNGTDLNNALLQETIFANVNLAEAKGLDTCRHEGPSTLDFRTLQKSGALPLTFLRGCGLPDLLIGYLPSLLINQPIQFYSCFISYSSKDEEFARRLHASLQNKGVCCWFAPEDIHGGRKIYE